MNASGAGGAIMIVAPSHVTPIRTRLTVLGDGTTETCELVFCEAETRSVSTSQCRACPYADLKSNEAARDGVVDCGCSILPIAGGAAYSTFPPAVAASLPVGLALTRSVVCVRDDLPWLHVARIPMLHGSLCGVPIVDGQGALAGILPAVAIARAGRIAPDDRSASVADRAVSALSVHESESLGEAFATMGHRRLRELTVVTDELRVVGVLRDTDALRFVAHVARTGARPAPERAA